MSGTDQGTGGLLAEQAQVLEQIVRGAPLADVLAALCMMVEAHAGSSVRAAILLVDDTGTALTTGAAPSLPESYCRQVDGIAIASDVGTCCAAAALRQVIVTPDIATAPGWAALRHLPLAHGLVAAWSMPILSSTQTVLGTFGTYFLETREPRAHERQLVEVLARTAALAIERDRADRNLRASAHRHEFLAQLDTATQQLSDSTLVMTTATRMLAEHLDADRCAYAQIEDERIFVITGDYPRRAPSIVGRWDVSAFGDACVEAMRTGTAFVVDDTNHDPRLRPEDRTAYEATQIGAVVCIPLHKDGRFTAAMAVHQCIARRWTTAEVDLISIVVARCWETLERMRVTSELRASELRYRTMVEATPECVKVIDTEGTLLQMNAAGHVMLEAEPGHVIGTSVYPVIAPEHRGRFQRFNEQVCAGTPGFLEFDIVGSRGTRRTMETTAVALPSTGGDGFVHLAISRDVSSRVRADRALAESRARLDYAVRLSGVGFWYCDLPFEDLIWDERVKAHFFLPPDAHVPYSLFYDRIHPDDRARTQRAIDESIANHSSYDIVYRTVDPATAAMKYIRALGGTAYDADGTPLRFDGVTVDVTAQKLDEERLARVAAAAIEIHTASTLDGVLRAITDEARHIIGANLAVASLTTGETAQAELEGHPRPPAPRSLAVPFVGRMGATLGQIQLSDKYAGDFTAADEAVIVQLAQLAAIAIENVRLNEQLRDQDRRKDEFLATLAHELRNPLAPIRTGLEVLQHGPAHAPKIHAMMDRQLDHLVHMVDDLLDISRITLGKVELKRARVDLRSVIDSALETTRPLVEAGGHDLSVHLPSAALPLEVDPTRLSQVFANLINNAVKYTPGGGAIKITASSTADSMLHVGVSDTGTGIPHHMLSRVFDMFTQVGRSIDRSQGGLGIGLTLVRRLVEMHGGTVDAESPGINAGSTFTVHLPLAVPMPAMVADPQAALVAGSSSSSLRVLVVDDNIDAAEMLSMLLEVGGYQTRMAHTGLEAIEAAFEFDPDVIFLDIGLPEMNGYEVATRLRASTELRQPMIVALTGWGSEDDRRQAHEAGFDRHLVKPIDSDKLHAVLAVARA